MPYTATQQAEIDARKKRGQNGVITVDRYGGNTPGGESHQTFDTSNYRLDPANQAAMQRSLSEGVMPNPDWLYGPAGGRAVSADEKKYRSAFASANHAPSGVTAADALKAVAIFATVAFGGGALAGMRAGAGAAVGATAQGAGVGATAAAPGATAAAAPAAGAGTVAAAGEALPEIIVSGTHAGAGLGTALGTAGAIGAGIGLSGPGGGMQGSSLVEQAPKPQQGIPYPSEGAANKGFWGTLKDFATSEGGMNLIGGALQGYAADRQQKRTIEEQRRYSRPFTSKEIEGITRGMDVQVPGGFLENARRVGAFLNGPANPSVGAPTTTPEQTAAMARGPGY